jgi:WD40 repeat protein
MTCFFLGRSTATACVLVGILAMSICAQAPTERSIRAIAFSSDGELIAASSGEPNQEGTITIWEVGVSKRVWTHRAKKGIPAVAFAPDRKTLAIGGYDKVAKLLDATSGGEIRQWEHPSEVRDVAFSPDGKLLATACWDGNVRVYEVASGNLNVTCKAPKDRLFRVQFSPDGKWLVSAGHRDGPKLWEVATGAERRDLIFRHDGFFVPAVLFADSHWLLTGGYDGTIRLWSLETGKLRATFGGIGGVGTLDFSPKAGKILANASLFEFTLREATHKEQEQTRVLLARLDDDSYELREATCKELLKIGFVIEPELQKAIKEAKSAEVRIRARQVREQLLNEPRQLLASRKKRDAEAIKLSPDGSAVASGGKGGVVHLTDIITGKEIAKFAAE